MNTTQRLTVRSGIGALHVIAIWQGLTQYADKIGAVSARVDPTRGEERLTIEVVDVSELQLYRIAAALNRSPLLMFATIEPSVHHSHEAGHGPA